MTELTPAQKEAYARAHSSTVHRWALEFRHPTFPSPIRLVQVKQDELLNITLEASAPVNGGESVAFTPLAFEVNEPELSTEPDTTISIQMDGVSGEVQPYMHAANQSSVPIECALRPFSFDVVSKAVGQLLGVYHLQVRHMSITKNTVSIQLGYTNSANRAFPAINYTAESNPGLL